MDPILKLGDDRSQFGKAAEFFGSILDTKLTFEIICIYMTIFTPS